MSSSVLTLPSIPVIARSHPQRAAAAPWYVDRWHMATLFTATMASILATWAAYESHTILLYSDAHSHLDIARRVIDNIQPGIGQFGGVWLPLPHIIMLPFIWNDFLWSTGLAGSLASMPCYVVASLAIFLTIRRLTHDSRASFIGSLVFILNPNILYLQSTPLSEPVLFATLTIASYFFVVWAQVGKARYLLLAALGTLLATVARYDGWPLFMAFLVLIPIIGWRRGNSRGKVLGDLVLFGGLGGLGIGLWILWNEVLYGNALYFANGPFSSQEQTSNFINAGVADTDHNLLRSLWTYTAATAESIGPLLLALGVIAVLVFTVRRKLSPESLAALTFLVPFPFYVAALFNGQDVLYVFHANHPPGYTLFNARFGAEMAAPAAIFVGTLAFDLFKRFPLWHGLIVAIVLVQQTVIATGGVISLQDGQFGTSCFVARPVEVFIAQHYDGGRILVDLYHSEIDLAPASIPFRDMVYEGSGAAWQEALGDPTSTVQWIVTQKGDLITAKIDVDSVAFLSEFTPVQTESDGITLWHRTGLAPLPDYPVPANMVAPYRLCNQARNISAG